MEELIRKIVYNYDISENDEVIVIYDTFDVINMRKSSEKYEEIDTELTKFYRSLKEQGISQGNIPLYIEEELIIRSFLNNDDIKNKKRLGKWYYYLSFSLEARLLKKLMQDDYVIDYLERNGLEVNSENIKKRKEELKKEIQKVFRKVIKNEKLRSNEEYVIVVKKYDKNINDFVDKFLVKKNKRKGVVLTDNINEARKFNSLFSAIFYIGMAEDTLFRSLEKGEEVTLPYSVMEEDYVEKLIEEEKLTYNRVMLKNLITREYTKFLSFINNPKEGKRRWFDEKPHYPFLFEILENTYTYLPEYITETIELMFLVADVYHINPQGVDYDWQSFDELMQQMTRLVSKEELMQAGKRSDIIQKYLSLFSLSPKWNNEPNYMDIIILIAMNDIMGVYENYDELFEEIKNKTGKDWITVYNQYIKEKEYLIKKERKQEIEEFER